MSRGRNVEQRVKSATGGALPHRESAPAGGKVQSPNWMEGEYFDPLQAAQGVIDPKAGETYFRADERSPEPYSDRSARQGWRPASDVGGGTAVQMPYATH